MKNVQYYLDRLDLAKLDDYFGSYVSIEEMAEEFGFYDAYDIMQDDANIRLKRLDHPELTWLCTDTGVGVSFIFLDRNFVGLIIQTARKEDAHYYWKDRESFEKVEKYIRELVCKRIKNPIFIDFEQDIEPFEQKKKEMDAWNGEQYEKYTKPYLNKNRKR